MFSSAPTDGHGFINHSKNVIMLIEDDDNHAELTTRIIRDYPIPIEVLHFPNGHSALDFLFRRSDVGDRDVSVRPQLILLDLHLPDTSGIEVLRTIKASEELRMIPVVMLTTSATDQEIASAYKNHLNSYLVKPVGCDEFRELIHVLCSYWLGNNRRSQSEKVRPEALQIRMAAPLR